MKKNTLLISSFMALISPSFSAYSSIINEDSYVLEHSYDDAEERLESGRMSRSSGDLEIGGIDGNNYQIVGLRFTNINIPADANVTEVYIQFNTDENSEESQVNIKMESSNHGIYGSSDYDISSREYTTATVDWNVPQITKTNQRTDEYRTPNLIDLVNEAQDTGWSFDQGWGFKISGNGAAPSTMDSRNSGSNASPTLIVRYETDYKESAYIVETNHDDAEERLSNGAVNLSSGDLELGGIERSNAQITGIRFNHVQIPQDANVKEAYIQFTTDETSGGADIKIHTEIGRSETFNTDEYNISNRKRSTFSVDWNVESVTEVNVRDKTSRTPNLRNIINENRLSGWLNGEALTFIFVGDEFNKIAMDSRNSGSDSSPELVLIYDDNTDAEWIDGLEDDSDLITDIYINEVSANDTAKSNFDWIEIYNNHDFPVLLNENFYLTDDEDSLEDFQFNEVYIPAKSYVSIIADKTPELGKLHANFKIKSKGGTVYLSKSHHGNVSIIDKFEYGSTEYDETYGRLPDASSEIVKFLKSGSMGESNTDGIQNIDLTANYPRGVYNEPFSLELTASQESNIIYTTDGSFPNKDNGIQYSGPIDINSNQVIKAIAYNDNGSSTYETNTYILAKSDDELKYTDLYESDYFISALKEIPIVSISKDSDGFTSNETFTTFEYFDESTNSDINTDNGVSIEAGVKKFGAWSSHYRKNNVRFYFRKDYGHGDLEYDIFPEYDDTDYPAVNEFSRLELKIGEDGVLNNDFSFGYLRLSDKIMHDSMLEMGNLDVHTKIVHVFVNGKYYGVETLRERFDDDFAESYLGGDNDDYVRIKAIDGGWRSGSIEESEHRPQWDEVKDLAKFNDYQAVKKLVNMDDYIRMMLMYLSVDIEYESRGLMNTENSDKKIHFNLNDSDGLLWNKNGWRYTTHWGGHFDGPGYIFGMFTDHKNIEFMTNVKDYVAEQLTSSNGILTKGNFENKIRTLSASIEKSYLLDVSRWGYREDLHEKWKEEYSRIIDELSLRFEDVLYRLEDKGLAHTLSAVRLMVNNEGSTLNITNQNSDTTVFFTTDGSDPMGDDGLDASDVAMEYIVNETNIRVNEGDHIAARAFTDGNWGPLTTLDI